MPWQTCAQGPLQAKKCDPIILPHNDWGHTLAHTNAYLNTHIQKKKKLTHSHDWNVTYDMCLGGPVAAGKCDEPCKITTL